MKRKERNRETNTNQIMRRKKKIKVDIEEEKLDPDMQLDIISRLPFKEAVRCRCVCKSWRILLDDNFLINNHPKTPLKLNSEYHHHHHAHSYSYSSSSSRLSFISTPRTSTHNDDNDSSADDVDNVIFGVYDYDVNDMGSYKESRSSFKYPSTSFRNARAISSCNGLICLSITSPGDTNFMSHAKNVDLTCSSSIIIYNPITKEKLNLRTYDEYSWVWQYKTLTCGFGYHPSTKQYKILRCGYNKIYGFLSFEIYTLGSSIGKWRQIKAPKDPNFDYHVPGVHVNGALYWITDYFNKKKKKRIISFDLGDDEEFRIITSLPPLHSNNSKKQGSSLVHYKLKESQGCLYLIVDYHSYTEIWLMMKKEKRRMPEKTKTTKKYKRDHRHHYSWTTVMKISTDRHRKGEEFEFVGLTKSGKVLFWEKSVLTCYDPKTERFESLSSASSGAYRRTFVPHVNSLVSLMALQSTATTGEEKYLCISKACTFSLQAKATTEAIVPPKANTEVYEKFVDMVWV